MARLAGNPEPPNRDYYPRPSVRLEPANNAYSLEPLGRDYIPHSPDTSVTPDRPWWRRWPTVVAGCLTLAVVGVGLYFWMAVVAGCLALAVVGLGLYFWLR